MSSANFPDDVVAASTVTKVAACGAFASVSTTKLLTVEEMLEALRSVGGMAYRGRALPANASPRQTSLRSRNSRGEDLHARGLRLRPGSCPYLGPLNWVKFAHRLSASERAEPTLRVAPGLEAHSRIALDGGSEGRVYRAGRVPGGADLRRGRRRAGARLAGDTHFMFRMLGIRQFLLRRRKDR